MTVKKQKLELTWIGKEHRPRLEPRILLEDPEKSYHAQQRVTENDRFENRLIFGDNLLALKALEQEFTGQKRIKALESQRNEQRRSLFEAQDRVDLQREELISNIEWKLTQKSRLQNLFTIRLALK